MAQSNLPSSSSSQDLLDIEKSSSSTPFLFVPPVSSSSDINTFKKPETFKVDVNSSLLARLSSFLPTLESSNKELQSNIAQFGSKKFELECTSDDEEDAAAAFNEENKGRTDRRDGPLEKVEEDEKVYIEMNLGLGLFESRPLPSQSGDPNLIIPSGKSVTTKSNRNCKIQDISSTTNSALSDSASNLNSKWNESLDQNVVMESQKEKNYNEHGENMNALDFPTENISLESVIHNFLLDVQGRSGDIQTRDLNGLVQNGVRVDDSLGLGLGCGLEGQRYESSDSDSDNGGSDSDEDMDEDSSSDGTSSDEGSTSSDEEETGKVGDNMDVDLIDR